ncbi:MAG: hypothetical protein Tsb0017_08770 [Geothermobacteraceae bacterium]
MPGASDPAQRCQGPDYPAAEGGIMKLRKTFFDFEYTEVLDIKTRELIRVACAVAVHCPD